MPYLLALSDVGGFRERLTAFSVQFIRERLKPIEATRSQHNCGALRRRVGGPLPRPIHCLRPLSPQPYLLCCRSYQVSFSQYHCSLICSTCSVWRVPCTMIFEDALSISRTKATLGQSIARCIVSMAQDTPIPLSVAHLDGGRFRGSQFQSNGRYRRGAFPILPMFCLILPGYRVLCTTAVFQR